LPGVGWGPEFRVITRARRSRTFASDRMAAVHDAPRVAAELRHTSPQMLYSSYRELVLREEAERYWKIAPTAETKNILAFLS
jgi:DICT domain-containing protein